MRSAFAVILCLLISSVAALADTPMTNLKIAVKNLEGKPVERASVIVTWKSSRSITKLGRKVPTRWEIRTNQQGVATMPALPQGNILVQVIAKPYQTYGETVEVDEAEKMITVTLNPPQQQYSAHQ